MILVRVPVTRSACNNDKSRCISSDRHLSRHLRSYSPITLCTPRFYFPLYPGVSRPAQTRRILINIITLVSQEIIAFRRSSSIAKHVRNNKDVYTRARAGREQRLWQTVIASSWNHMTITHAVRGFLSVPVRDRLKNPHRNNNSYRVAHRHGRSREYTIPKMAWRCNCVRTCVAVTCTKTVLSSSAPEANTSTMRIEL